MTVPTRDELRSALAEVCGNVSREAFEAAVEAAAQALDYYAAIERVRELRARASAAGRRAARP